MTCSPVLRGGESDGGEMTCDKEWLWDWRCRRQSKLAIQMEGTEKAAVIVVRQVCFQRVLCQRRLYPQPAQQQQPDFQLGTTHRPL